MKNVVFDTNAYRTFAGNMDFETIQNEVIRIKQLEFKAGYLPCVNTHVSLELLKHLRNDQARHYDRCRKALRAQYIHCSIENKKFPYGVQTFVIPYKTNAIRKYLGMQEGESVNELQEGAIEILKFVNSCEPQYWPSELINDLEVSQSNFNDYKKVIIKELGIELLEMFGEESTENIILSLKNDKNLRINSSKAFKGEKFENIITEGFVGIAKELGYDKHFSSIEFDVLKSKIKPVIEFLRIFYKSTIDGLPQSGQRILQDDTSNRWNTFIDMEIIGETLLSNSLLVTNEIGINEAYKVSGKGELVFTVNDYLRHIGYYQ